MTGRRVRRPPGYWDEIDAQSGQDGGTRLTGSGDTGSFRLPSWIPRRGGGVSSPSRTDEVARAASTAIGGPAGRRLATATGFWRALPVLVLLAAVVMGLGLVQKEHCRAQGWSTPDQFWHACYSDIPVLFQSGSLGDDARPSLQQSLGDGGLGLPPVSGAAMWIVSGFIPAGDDSAREFFDLSAVLLYLVLAGAVYGCVVIAGRRGRPWDAAHLALSPILLTSALISYQLLAVGLLVLAILAWTRERPVWAGVWFGLAVAAGPVLSLVGVAVLALSVYARRAQPALGFLAAGLLTWWLTRIVLLPGLFGGIRTAWHNWTGSDPGYGSLWLVPQLLQSSNPDRDPTSAVGRVLLRAFGWIFHAHPLDGSASSALALLMLIVLVPPVLWFSFGGGLHESAYPNRPEQPSSRLSARLTGIDLLAPLGLALLAVGLIVLKSLPVQTSLLLLPLIALSGLRWRDHLIWAVTELVYFVGVWLYIAADSDPNRGLPDQFYLLMLLARLAGIAWIAVQAVLLVRHRLLLAGDELDQPGEADSVDAAGELDFAAEHAAGYALPGPPESSR